MIRGLTRQPSRVDEENPYWISFSDLMSGLLVIFILASVALIIELTQKTEELEKRTQMVDEGIEELKNAEQARRDILFEVLEELKQKNIDVLIADNETVIRIPEETLTFDSGKESIPDYEGMKEAVKEIGVVLHQAIMRHDRFRYLDTVFVEGHTDSDSIYYRGKGNWGLSTDRAISVWKSWTSNEALSPAYSDLENAFGQTLFSVSGYAATRRIQKEELTQEQKAQNRWIDIRFTVKKPSISDLEKIKPTIEPDREG